MKIFQPSRTYFKRNFEFPLKSTIFTKINASISGLSIEIICAHLYVKWMQNSGRSNLEIIGLLSGGEFYRVIPSKIRDYPRDGTILKL